MPILKLKNDFETSDADAHEEETNIFLRGETLYTRVTRLNSSNNIGVRC